MCTSLSNMDGQLAEPVRGAESQVGINSVGDVRSRKAVLEKVRAAVAFKNNDGPDGEQNQDFLYDELGLNL